MTTQDPISFKKTKNPGCFSYDNVNRVKKTSQGKLLPGSFVYDIVNTNDCSTREKKPFYVQNCKSYLDGLEKNCKKLGVPFKKPNVEEIPIPEKINVSVEDHIKYLDKVIVKLNVLKNGKVRVKIFPEMAQLNEIYYSKAKQPPIKTLLTVLKKVGYSKEFIDATNDKHKKRHKLIETRWKKLEKFFDTPSVSSRNRKKKKEKEEEKEKEKEKEEEIQDDKEENEEEENEEEENEGLDIEQDEDDIENVEEEYVSDGGDY
tara:strand:+ start:223 stop:1002 length:780 start_codon:yes stop_codon:yes gene_type:complete